MATTSIGKRELLKKGNYGIRTGLCLDDYGKYLVVLDVDKLSEHKKIKDKLISLYKDNLKVLTASGNSIHLYTLLDNSEHTRSGKLVSSDGITLGDYLGKGKQVIGPYSTIKEKEYRILGGEDMLSLPYSTLISRLDEIGVRIRHFEEGGENRFEAPKTDRAYASLLHGSRSGKNTSFNPKTGNWRCWRCETEFKKEWEIVSVRGRDKHCSQYVLNCCSSLLKGKVIEHEFRDRLEDTRNYMEDREGLVLLQAPTGVGKSFRLLERAIMYARRGVKSLILTTTINNCKSLAAELGYNLKFNDYGGYFDVIRGDYDSKVFISTYASFNGRILGGELDEVFKLAGLVIVDEADEGLFDYLRLSKIRELIRHKKKERIIVSATLNYLLLNYVEYLGEEYKSMVFHESIPKDRGVVKIQPIMIYDKRRGKNIPLSLILYDGVSILKEVIKVKKPN